MTAEAPAGELVDTIVAPATAPGSGERAMVRLSGPAAQALAWGLLTVTRVPVPGRLGQGWLDLSGETVPQTGAEPSAAAPPQAGSGAGHESAPEGLDAPVPVGLLFFAGPRSLTGEDVIEMHLPGWPALVTELLRRCVAAGARPAARGEFLRRAVVHGRIDLQGALAVGRLAASRGADDARAAAASLTGRTARLGEALRGELLNTLALLEAHVDFEEEDTEAIGESELRAGLARATGLTRDLLSAGLARAPADGETDVVLLGPPNAGKSSLFLALCPGAETTVSPQPGTTRDALTATIEQRGRRWRLIDGPGVGALQGLAAAAAAPPEAGPEDVADPASAPGPARLADSEVDSVDALAAERFLAALPPRAVVLHVESVQPPGLVGSTTETAEHRRRRLSAVGDRVLISVASRCDLLPAGAQRPPGLCTSSVTGEGLPALWDALLAAAPAPRAADQAEQAESEAAAEILPLLEQALQGELWGSLPVLSLQLREALERLESEREQPLDVTRELLDRIFSGFCIGK